MKKLIGLFVLVLFSVQVATAQEFVFKVLGSKGNNTSNKTTLKVGAKLQKGETIVVEGTYLGLSHATGKIVELTKAGTYKVDEIAAKLNGTASVTNKYYDFVVAELTNGQDVAAAKQRANHMAKTGSVTRDIGALGMMLHTTNNVFNNTIVVKWYIRDNAGVNHDELQGYKIIVSDISENLLFTTIVTDPTTVLDLNQGKMANEQQLIVKVVPVGKDGKEKIDPRTVDGNAIIKLDEETKKTVQAELKVITGENVSNGAIAKLVEARFFEDRELYADAIIAYEQALKISEGTEQYQRIYKYFLDRNLLSKESRLALEQNDEGK